MHHKTPRNYKAPLSEAGDRLYLKSTVDHWSNAQWKRDGVYGCVGKKVPQQRVESQVTVSLWRGNIILSLSGGRGGPWWTELT